MTDTPDNVTPLGVVPKPKVSDLIQRDIAGLLAQLTALSTNGELSSLFCVVAHPDGTFSEAVSKTGNFREMIGQIEIVKQQWVGQYLASLEGHPIGPKEPG